MPMWPEDLRVQSFGEPRRMNLAMLAPHEVPAWFVHKSAPMKIGSDGFTVDDDAWIMADKMARIVQWAYAWADAMIAESERLAPRDS